MEAFFFLLLGFAVTFFWIHQFVQLMLIEDELLPGRHDKLIWGAAFILLAPLAPFAFLVWKRARVAERHECEGIPREQWKSR